MTQGRGKYGKYIKFLIAIGDIVILNLVYLFFVYVLDESTSFWSQKTCVIANLAYLWSVSFFINHHDLRSTSIDRVALCVVKQAFVNICIFIALLYIGKIPRFQLRYIALFYVIFICLQGCWWVVAHLYLRKKRSDGYNFKRIIIVGYNDMAFNLLDELKQDNGYGYRLEGIFSDTQIPDEYPFGGRVSDVAAYLDNNFVDEMYCVVQDIAVSEAMIDVADKHAVDFVFVPQVSSRLMRHYTLRPFGNVPTLSLRSNPLSEISNRILKRTFDLVVSSVFLLIFPIIYIPVAIAIKLSSPGPVFFKQLRTGYRGKDFYCYKFRSMRQNAQCDTCQASKTDSRKTRVGDFLRKTSIDELPQFINVWKGEMSIVGPRPHMLKHTREYGKLIDKYMLRHTIKPGITGWAQVNGFRGETKELWQMEKRVSMDVWYAENWNFMLDLRIILKTVLSLFGMDKNAY